MEGADNYLLERFRRQEILTAPLPRRADITSLVINEPIVRSGTVAVWRNHAIEPLEPLLVPFLRTAGLDLDVVPGGYDDALTQSPASTADLDLIWFDLDRLALDDEAALAWFSSRVKHCVATSSGTALIVPISDRHTHVGAANRQLRDIPGVLCADPWEICDQANVNLIDDRTAALAGTRISRNAQIHLARALGARWLPAAFLPPVKMVAVDLDETLHRGILGENGIDGVEVTPAHLRFHHYLKELANSGVLLALISRNELADVEQLFEEKHGNYGIGLTDFSAIEVSWGSKAAAVRRAAHHVRIGEDAVVFIDDNAGELLTVGLECPAVRLVHAQPDAARTVDALRWQPGIWRWKRDDAAAIRAGDLAANQTRDQLLNDAENFDRYLEQLGVRAEIGVDVAGQLTRLADLSAKTNQFNLSLSRLTEIALAGHLQANDTHVISVGLTDRLSDSGIIALLVVRFAGELLHIEELAISCRAMGRGLESILISQALRQLPRWDDVHQVIFVARTSERNAPARKWLSEFSGLADFDGVETVAVASALFDAVALPPSVIVTAIGLSDESS